MSRTLTYEEAQALERFPKVRLRRAGKKDSMVPSDEVPTSGIIRIQFLRGKPPIVELAE